MSVLFVKKTTTGEFDIGVDFTDKLASGRTISSCTVGAIVLKTGANATSTVLADGTASVVGAVATEQITGGSAGQKYRLRFTATLDDSSTISEDVYLFVES